MANICAISVTLSSVIILNMLGQCEMSLYPGLRRKPPQPALQYDVPSDFLAQLMEENARRRLQQQFEQQLELINMQIDMKNRQRQREAEQQEERYRQMQLQRQRQRLQWLQELAENEADLNEMDNGEDVGDDDNNNINNTDVDDDGSLGRLRERVEQQQQYANYPNMKFDRNLLKEPIQFGVRPNDPRYYMDNVPAPAGNEDTDNATEDGDELDAKTLAEYEEYKPAETNDVIVQNGVEDKEAVLSPAPVETSKLTDPSSSTTFHRIKPQSAAAAAVAGVNVVGGGELATNLVGKTHKPSKTASPLSGEHDAQHIVVRQHIPGMDNDMGIYVVALLAGISAAVTVGIIGLGIAWLHNKNKSAADVDYPAYGVTGPNKDISPSGDRKLAQSAQMFHYQHQKQQIIAMENRQAEGSCGGLSDVESDEEEEGDYTVYECPGLAPTGEMEVKNPLFLDETPMTPATAGGAAAGVITQAQPAQPPAMKKQGKASAVNATTAVTTVTSSNEKPSKKNKK